ncbi:MAG: hypothetical protein HPY66_2468 [Firmicutes bacterium]|nr:hypothetical protein [Bacillota bacterium]
MIKKVAVLGAGNAGTTFSGHLAIKGFEVRLYEAPQFKQNLKAIIEKGGVEVTGVVEGFGRVEKATTDMKEAVSGADLILMAVPAFAHEFMMNEYLPHAEEGQIVVFLPGNYGDIRFYNLLKEKGMEDKVDVASTASMIYACRRIEANKVKIMAIKYQMPVAVLPSRKTEKVVKALKELFEEFVPAKNVLEVSLNNLNCVLHTPTSILNAGRIENTKGNFDFYWEGMTESVCRVLEAVDNERLCIGEKLGINLVSTKRMLYDFYGLKGKDLHEIVTTSEVHGGSGSPGHLKHRYVVEDTLFGLVPISSLGKYLGCDTPNTDAVIRLASTLNNADYWKEGITVEKLGFEKMNKKEIVEFLERGY